MISKELWNGNKLQEQNKQQQTDDILIGLHLYKPGTTLCGRKIEFDAKLKKKNKWIDKE